VIDRRRSVRDFGKKRASFKLVIDAVDAANQGPFASNHNNLKFLIVENPDKIAEIADASEQDWIATSGIVVLIVSDDKHLENVYGERGRVYSKLQAGAAINTFMLKLTDFGLDSCWVGAYSHEKLRKAFKMPKHVQIEAVVPIGYAVKHNRKKEKKELEWSLFWEEWGAQRRPTKFEENVEERGTGKGH